jgi:hypothetical protein
MEWIIFIDSSKLKLKVVLLNNGKVLSSIAVLQGGREVTVNPENTHLKHNSSLHSTAQHAVQCKMVAGNSVQDSAYVICCRHRI